MKQDRFCLPRLAFLWLRIVNHVRFYKKTVFSFLMKRLDNIDPRMSSSSVIKHHHHHHYQFSHLISNFSTLVHSSLNPPTQRLYSFKGETRNQHRWNFFGSIFKLVTDLLSSDFIFFFLFASSLFLYRSKSIKIKCKPFPSLGEIKTGCFCT